jgi:hypothetical protein
MSDDFTLLCDEFGLTDTRRRGLLWHALCRARAVGGMQVCISIRQIIGKPHPVLIRSLTLGEVHQAVKLHQRHQAEDLEKWHDLPEKYRTEWVTEFVREKPHPETCMCQECMPTEGAKNGTGETPAVRDGNESTAPESGGAEAGECGGCDDADSGH